MEVAGNATQTFYNKMDLLSLGIALVLGTAGLPHILIRFYTVPTARAARKSVLWAIGIIGAFYLFTLALGFGAAALVGSEAITAQDTGRQHRRAAAGRRRSASTSSAATLGGATLLAIIAAVAFATILAVVAGLTLASSSSLAHDFYANVIKKGEASERQEVRVARISALVIGAVVDRAGDLRAEPQRGVPGGAGVRGRRVGQPAGDPLLLFWKRFNTSGAVWAIYGGLISAVVLVFFSPVVSGAATVDVPEPRLAVVPAVQPGHHLDPVRLPLRLDRHAHLQGARRGQVRGARGPLPHRRRRALTDGHVVDRGPLLTHDVDRGTRSRADRLSVG